MAGHAQRLADHGWPWLAMPIVWPTMAGHGQRLANGICLKFQTKPGGERGRHSTRLLFLSANYCGSMSCLVTIQCLRCSALGALTNPFSTSILPSIHQQLPRRCASPLRFLISFLCRFLSRFFICSFLRRFLRRPP